MLVMKKKKHNSQQTLDAETERWKIARRDHRRNRFLLFHRFMFWGWVVIFLVALVEHLLNPGVPTVYVRWHEPEMAMLMMIAMLVFHYLWVHIGRSEDRALRHLLGDAGEKRKLNYGEESALQALRLTASYDMQLGDTGKAKSDESPEDDSIYHQQMIQQRHK